MYPHNQKYLKELKYSLTRQIWNRFTSTIKEPQMQGILQGFRVVGSGSKLGREYPVTAYRFGGSVELERLLDYIPDSNGEQQRLEGLMRKSRLSLAEAKEKYPDWYERYPECGVSYNYVTDCVKMRWKQTKDSDPDGLQKMTAEEIAEYLYRE